MGHIAGRPHHDRRPGCRERGVADHVVEATLAAQPHIEHEDVRRVEQAEAIAWGSIGLLALFAVALILRRRGPTRG